MAKDVFARVFGLPVVISALMTTPAAAFDVDLSLVKAQEALNVLTVGRLAVGETGLIPIYRSGLCLDGAALKIHAAVQLDDSPSEYSYALEIQRQPGNAVEIRMSDKGKAPDLEGVRDGIINVASASSCEPVVSRGIPLLDVTSYFGSSSMSELLGKLGALESLPKASSKKSQNLSSKSIPELSRWSVIEDKSPIDDSPSVILIKESEGASSYRSNALILRCQENKTEAYLKTGEFLGDSSSKMVVRYDTNQAENRTMGLSTDNKALFFEVPIREIKRMAKAERMVARVQTFRGSNVTMEFSLKGLDEELPKLRKACNW